MQQENQSKTSLVADAFQKIEDTILTQQRHLDFLNSRVTNVEGSTANIQARVDELEHKDANKSCWHWFNVFHKLSY